MHNIEAVRRLATDLELRAKEIQNALDEESASVRAERERWEREKLEMSTKFGITDNILELNVGGAFLTTYKSVVCKQPESLLAAMFSGRHSIARDSAGKYFIDCDGEAFRYLLHFLRTDKLVWPDSQASRQIFRATLDYLSIALPLFNDSAILNETTVGILAPLLPDFAGQDLLYRGSLHGFSSATFHQRCDGVSNTILLVKVGDNVFGGFSPATWNGVTNSYTPMDANSFLFSLANPTSTSLGIKFLNTGIHSKNSNYCNNGYGPTFGGGHDIHVASNGNANNSSYSNLGHSYSHPTFAYNSNEVKNFFCGSYNFQVSEVEVYALTK